MTRANLTCADCGGKGVDAHGHPGCPTCGGDVCGDCGGTGAPGGCGVCGKTATPSPRPRPSPPASGRGKKVAKWLAGSVAVLGLVALAIWGGSKLFKSSTPDMTAAPGPSSAPPAANSGPNLDPTKVAAGPNPESCGKGVLWDPEIRRCVPKADPPPPPPAIPSTITVNIPCPSACPPPGPVASASAAPVVTAPPPPPKPAFIPVVVDLSKIGDPAVFPGGK